MVNNTTAVIDDENCQVCRKGDQEEYLILCDGCDRAYHTFCKTGCDCCGEKPKGLFGKKPSVPEGDWFCKHCADHAPKVTSNRSPEMFAFGSNVNAQLGLGSKHEAEYVALPTPVTEVASLDLAQVSCGENFTLLLTTEGDVYSAGGGDHGQLGHPDIIHESLPSFRRIVALDEQNRPKIDGPITKLVSGAHFSTALTSQGQLYSWGFGECGNLGHQENKHKKVAKKISALKELDNVIVSGQTLACGDEFVLATSMEEHELDQFNTSKPGVLLAWGSNAHGQLGDASGRNQWVPQLLNPNGPETTPASALKTKHSNESFSLGRDIQSLGGGSSHAVAVTEAGQVFSWGYGQLGQLGQPVPEAVPGASIFMKKVFRVPRPRYVNALSTERIVDVSCGANFTLLRSLDNQLWGFGDNTFGQLGLNLDSSVVDVPSRIIACSDVTQMSCGVEHALVLTREGKVFAFGRASEGQCGVDGLEIAGSGLGNSGNDVSSNLAHAIRKPTLVTGVPEIGYVSCGGYHSMVLAKSATTRPTNKRPASALEKKEKTSAKRGKVTKKKK